MPKAWDDCPPGCPGLDGPDEDRLGSTFPGVCRVVDELGLLWNISYTLESSLDLRDVIRPVLLKLAEGMAMKRGTIIIPGRQDDGVSICESVGLPAGREEDYLAACRRLVSQILESGQALILPDISQEPSLYSLWDSDSSTSGARHPVAFIGVPIKFGDETVGVLSVERVRQGRVRLSADRRLLSLIAILVAQAVHFRRVTQDRWAELRQENERLLEELNLQTRPGNMIGSSGAMRSVYLQIAQVAGSTATVLIRGESGVGKELVARAVHDQSPRKVGPFVKFNCAALPESIIESELFGHEKGAFTGAIAARKGRFETANGGTIFLDEIGDLSPSTQVKLLRVLQEREFERVGSQRPIRCDVRVIAATSRNLEDMMEKQQLRPDLFYRLNVFPIFVPPLRDRRPDVLLLADHFVEKFGKSAGKSVRRISTAAIDLLTSYHWPGNVRELENCMERAVLLCGGTAIEAHHLPPTLQKPDPSEKGSRGNLESALAALEYELVVAELKNCAGNMARAARNLGITERQMGLRVARMGIEYRRFRRAPAR